MMKKIIWMVMIVFMAFSFFGCRNDEEIEDGGHQTYVNESLPKKIESTDLSSFDTDFVYEGEYESGRYALKLDKKDDHYEGSYRYLIFNDNTYTPTFPFETDETFIKRLNDIIVNSNIISHNGVHEKTNGIPEDFGYSFYAAYASGELISCSDNSSNILPVSMMDELISLFYQESGAMKYYESDRLQNIYYSIYERDVFSYYASIYEDYDGTYHFLINESHENKWNPKLEGTINHEIFEEIEKIYDEYDLGNIDDFPRREGERYYELVLKWGKESRHIYSNTAISDEQFTALKDIETLIRTYCENGSD